MSRRQHTGRVSESELFELVSEIYDAALGSVTWESVLPHVVRSFGGEEGAFGVRPRIAEAALVIHHNVDPELLARWESEFSCEDPWLERFAEQKLPGELLHAGSESCLPDMRETERVRRLLRSGGSRRPRRDDVVRPWHVARVHGCVPVPLRGHVRRGRSARARLLTPHLVRAAMIHERSARSARRRRRPRRCSSAFRTACWCSTIAARCSGPIAAASAS